MRNILVVGGAGFIGSHLCERLVSESKNNFVCAADNLITGDVCNIENLFNNQQFKFVSANASDSDFDAQCSEQFYYSGVDDIYYLASIASPKHYLRLPFQTIEANIYGLMNCLQMANKYRSRILYTSTSEVYGDPLSSPQEECYNGNVDPCNDRSVYDETKRVGETLVSVFDRTRGIYSRIVRIFNTYGPNLNKNDGRVISTFIDQALRNAPMTIQGQGTQTRSFCYVDDTVTAIRLAMESSESRPMNIGNPNEYCSVLDLAFTIKNMIPGCKSEFVFTPFISNNDPTIRRPDITRIYKETSWQPKIPLREGLQKTIDWMRNQQ